MIQLFTFGPAFGLPTSGPFGLKLEACLRMLGVPYVRVVENDPRKGPKRKSPWIEDGAIRLGDTELILDYVATTYHKELDRELDLPTRARSLALRRMLEEHYHQVFEYELWVHEAGWPVMRSLLAAYIPNLVLAVIGPRVRSVVTKHLFERGIARHELAEVEAMGKADVDALSTWLGDREWFLGGDAPTKLDATAFGQLACSIRVPLETPVCKYVRSKPNLVAFVERMLARLFADVDR
jgi:glutathione S-transferase